MSDKKPFRAFGVSDAEYEELLILSDGVPTILREPLLAWLLKCLVIPHRYIEGGNLDDDLASQLFAMTRIDLGRRVGMTVDDGQVLRRLRSLTEHELLVLADALVSIEPLDTVVDVARSFDLASSKWEVSEVEGCPRLVARVPEGVHDQIVMTIKTGGNAGHLLHRAFTAAYGLSPNPGEAYKMSVKAVETAAHVVVEPKNTGATLGTMLSVMRNTRQPWTLPLTERADHAGRNASLIVSLAQSLWDGQEDRHRDGLVNLDEAKTAFHAATTLVAWFSDGLVSR